MIYISIETSGLRGADHEILQLNTLDDAGVVQSVNVRASKEVDKRAMEFNKLNPEIGISQAEFTEQWADKFVNELVVIHCKSFTVKFLMKAGIKLNRIIDLMDEAERLKLPKRMNALAKELGVTGTKCEKLRDCLKKMEAM